MRVWILAVWVALAAAWLFACTEDVPDASEVIATEPPTRDTSAATAVPTETPIPTPTLTTLRPTSAPVPFTPTPPQPPPPPRQAESRASSAPGLLRLEDFLDDPLGYCVDVAGFGANLRLDAPLQAHTCKPGSDDQLFSQRGDDGIRLERHDRCLSASAATAGSAVEVVTCDADAADQNFRLDGDGRVELLTADGSALCLGVAGGAGEPAGGRNHLRRDLVLYRCSEADGSLITWELVAQ